MQVNGKMHPHTEGLTLLALLDQLNIPKDRVAVMVGEQVFPSGHIEDVLLKPEDVIEIVRAMQGG